MDEVGASAGIKLYHSRVKVFIHIPYDNLGTLTFTPTAVRVCVVGVFASLSQQFPSPVT